MAKKYLKVTEELAKTINVEASLDHLEALIKLWKTSYSKYYNELWLENEEMCDHSPFYVLKGARKETDIERNKRLKANRDAKWQEQNRKMKKLRELADELNVEIREDLG